LIRFIDDKYQSFQLLRLVAISKKRKFLQRKRKVKKATKLRRRRKSLQMEPQKRKKLNPYPNHHQQLIKNPSENPDHLPDHQDQLEIKVMKIEIKAMIIEVQGTIHILRKPTCISQTLI
jgi:hypothetical protein